MIELNAEGIRDGHNLTYRPIIALGGGLLRPVIARPGARLALWGLGGCMTRDLGRVLD